MTQTETAECPHPEDDQNWTSECCGAGYVVDLSEDRLGFCAKCREGALFELVCDLCQKNITEVSHDPS